MLVPQKKQLLQKRQKNSRYVLCISYTKRQHPKSVVVWYYRRIMIRTRDLVLFVVTIFFLAIAVGVTWLVDSSSDIKTQPNISFIVSTDTYKANAPKKDINRQKTIQQLRQKLAQSTQTITPVASVEGTDSEVAIEDSYDNIGVQKCLYPDDALSMVPRWPLTGVQIETREGARVVFSQIEEVVSESTATESTTTLKKIVTTLPLIQLPLTPVKQAKQECVPSEVVGVTLGGVLIFNGDVNSYRLVPENTLIGYARDGFPIYGVYDDEVDACGGYDSPSGYRYTISSERDYIIGCYVGTPAKFSL